ncbi:MAG: NUDIX domain-containing protein [Xanthomonadaceae bacterium]|nr:NUDIX domain-containing protein [Rhodospirillaceae bacterium]NIA17849.1 NUDIX domain-containing protein [Xanthomonadaceae bacterium]
MENSKKEKIYEGAITIFYKKINQKLFFLVAKNFKTGNITFISGAKEGFDQSLLDSAKRENKEELNLDPKLYKLTPTKIKHKFIFGKKKKERVGCKGSYKVFISDLTNLNFNIKHTKELENIKWMIEKEVFDFLTFPDLKDVFKKTLEIIKL